MLLYVLYSTLCLPFYLCNYAAHCFTTFDLYLLLISQRVVSQKCASNSTMYIHDFFYFSGARCISLSLVILNHRKDIDNSICYGI